MQWDPFLTELYLIDNGIWLAVVLLGPAIVLRVISWHIERTSAKAFSDDSNSNESYRNRYENRPVLWTAIYNISNGSSTLLATIWFLAVFGFPAALIAFLTLMYVNGIFTDSLADVAKRLGKKSS
jgi:hypothetical protein